MKINLTDQIISQFLSGVFIIITLVLVGGILAFLLQGMNRRLPFTRTALVLALTPLSMIGFLDRSSTATLYLFSMISTLLGITIDGINYLLLPKEPVRRTEKPEKSKEEESESNPDVIVWEKAE